MGWARCPAAQQPPLSKSQVLSSIPGAEKKIKIFGKAEAVHVKLELCVIMAPEAESQPEARPGEEGS